MKVVCDQQRLHLARGSRSYIRKERADDDREDVAILLASTFSMPIADPNRGEATKINYLQGEIVKKKEEKNRLAAGAFSGR